ncbi:MAG: hypothetical protein AAF739_16460 [Pseudomonadota bacterium]
MLRSTDHILTTHVGSLPRPHDLLDVLKARLDGEPVDQAAYDAKIADAVDRMVQQQVEAGIDIVADGEMSKPGHAIYKTEVENCVVWAKLKSLAEGAEIASKQLWGYRAAS